MKKLFILPIVIILILSFTSGCIRNEDNEEECKDETIIQDKAYAPLAWLSNYEEVGQQLTIYKRYVKAVSFKIKVRSISGYVYFNIRNANNKNIIQSDKVSAEDITTDMPLGNNAWYRHVFNPPVFVNGEIILSIRYTNNFNGLVVWGAYPGDITGFAVRKAGNRWIPEKDWDVVTKIELSTCKNG